MSGSLPPDALAAPEVDTPVALERAVSTGRLRWRRFRRHRAAMVSLVVLLLLVLFCLAAWPLQAWLGIDPDATDLLSRFDPPDAQHWLGTDDAGRDELLRLMVGGQISLLVGLMATVVGGMIGLVIGVVSGYFGGRIDSLLMRFTDGMIILPLLPLLIVLGALDLTKLGFSQQFATSGAAGFWRIVIIISIVDWTSIARLVRAATLAIKERDFVRAARASGAGPFYVMRSHVLPNVATPIIVAFTLTVGRVILLESVLSFLGFGIVPAHAVLGQHAEQRAGAGELRPGARGLSRPADLPDRHRRQLRRRRPAARLRPPFGASLSPELTVVVPTFRERDNVAPLVSRLDAALAGIAWEVVFVDDDSPDGTAAEARRLAACDTRVRCIRRIGRRGLSSAVIEGALSSSAGYVAVMDGDLQHDETLLPRMLASVRGGADLAVASRHAEGGDASGLSDARRHRISRLGIRAANAVLPVRLSDPMSGFFLLGRELFERLAPRLSGQGFKILLDLLLSSPIPLTVADVPMTFRRRAAGDSKLDGLVMVQFAAMLLDKAAGGLLPLRFISFALVGAFGVLVDLAVLTALRGVGLGFATTQVIATLVAMVMNFWLNNVITYRSERLRGPALWRGLVLFMAVCGIGAIANVGIASMLYEAHSGWTPAGAMGAAIGVVWNYAVSATLVWRRR